MKNITTPSPTIAAAPAHQPAQRAPPGRLAELGLGGDGASGFGGHARSRGLTSDIGDVGEQVQQDVGQSP